jgi:hypothetical protein
LLFNFQAFGLRKIGPDVAASAAAMPPDGQKRLVSTTCLTTMFHDLFYDPVFG